MSKVVDVYIALAGNEISTAFTLQVFAATALCLVNGNASAVFSSAKDNLSLRKSAYVQTIRNHVA
jgi:hypothetical protein